MKRLLIGVAVATVLVGLTAPAHADVRRAILTSFEENPDISSPGHGDLTLIIARDDQSFQYELNFADLEGGDAVVAHIHLGKRGVNGGVMVFLCGGGGKPACPAATSGTVTGTVTAADVIGPAAQGVAAGGLDEVLFAIRRGHAYVNVHNATFPTGEIRGQIR